MTRSTLIRRLEALLPAAPATPPARPAGVRRRTWLQAGGALLGAAALPARGGEGSGAGRVAIVGGGIAGLVAALTLQEAGRPFSLFESSHRLGGRMHSRHGFWSQGQTSEWCGEFIDSTHLVLRGLAQRFGLALDDVIAAVPPGAVDTNLLLGDYYTDAALAADLLPVARVLLPQRAAVGTHFRHDDFNNAAAALDAMNCFEWIERHVPGGHGSRLGLYIDLAMVSLNGADTAQQSALNIVVPVHSDERFHVRDGNARIPQAIAAVLPADALHLGWRLEAIAAPADRAVALAFRTPAGRRTLAFDRVILALPFSVLRGVDTRRAGFAPRKQAMIAQLLYGTNSKLSLQFDQRYWNQRGAWPGIGDGVVATDLGFQGAWDSSSGQPGRDGLLTNYTGGAAGAAFRPTAPYTDSLGSSTTAAYANAFLAQLEQVWPGIASHYNGRATLSYPTGDPDRRGSYSAYGVGQYTAFCGLGGVPEGRIHFAGEHTSVDFLGYMEGGAETGLRAAGEVLAA